MIVIDGQLYPVILHDLQLNKGWLKQQLHMLGVSNMNEIFFASIDQTTNLHIS